jgi:hypothetical protein
MNQILFKDEISKQEKHKSKSFEIDDHIRNSFKSI